MIQRYVESRLYCEFGNVCNAFAESVRGLLDDWMLFVTALEHNLRGSQSRLETILFYSQPPMMTLCLVAGVKSCMNCSVLSQAALPCEHNHDYGLVWRVLCA
jgi:hypothetical protein